MSRDQETIMKLKSYFAESVETALSQARRELGADAMLVNSHRTSIEFRHLGEYEVVCALTRGRDGGETASQAENVRPAREQPLDKISQEVSVLRRQMERLASALARSGAGMSGLTANPGLAKIFAALTSAELDTDLAYEIVLRMGTHGSSELVRAELSKLVTADATLGRGSAANRIVALAGPPGSGKSTCIAKLAAQFGIAARRPCHILTIDTHGIATSEQLRSYAAILGVGFQDLGTVTALAQALEELRQKDLILIDTPGLSQAEMEDARELAHFLSDHPDIDTHLVLPASMRSSDLQRVADQYEIFGARKLIFTKLDETDTFGPIVNQSARTGSAVSFLSGGRRIPEDLQPASADVIVNLILKTSCEPIRGAVAAA